jgi:hypothetical protein
MSKRSDKFFNDRYEHLQFLTESILLDLARNEACPLEYRLSVVEIMRQKGFKKVNHPELAQLLAHVLEEEDEYGASKKAHFGPKIDPIPPDSGYTMPETWPEPPVFTPEIKESSIPSASVTTATMFGRHEIPEALPENEE